MKQSSLAVDYQSSMPGLVFLSYWLKCTIPEGYDARECKKVLSRAALFLEALLRVNARRSFYVSLLSDASALLDRNIDGVGEQALDERLQYAVKCCIVAEKRIFRKMCWELQQVPGIIVARQFDRQQRINPDLLGMRSWIWDGVSGCERTAVCMCDENVDPPFMNPCFWDKTCLIPEDRWSGDDGNYELVSD